MFHLRFARWLVALPALAALSAVAQPATPSSDAPSARVTTLPFTSAMEGYQTFKDEKAIPWREANDTVHRRGGWRAYAKEASSIGPAEAAPPQGAAMPGMDHSKHIPAKETQP